MRQAGNPAGMRNPVPRRTGRWLAAALTGGIVMLAGCSGGNVATKTMTQAQAATRAEQVLAGTAAAVKPRPRLDFDPRLGNGADQCLASIPNATEMVNVSRTAWLRQIPTSENGSVGQQILAFWKKQGYKITDYSGFSAGKPSIDAETKDYFTISLGTASNGLMSIGATSPCIYKNGTPPAS